MADDIQEKDPYIEGRARKFAKRVWQWRAAQAARRRDVFRQVNGIHAATCQRLM